MDGLIKRELEKIDKAIREKYMAHIQIGNRKDMNTAILRWIIAKPSLKELYIDVLATDEVYHWKDGKLSKI